MPPGARFWLGLDSRYTGGAHGFEDAAVELAIPSFEPCRHQPSPALDQKRDTPAHEVKNSS